MIQNKIIVITGDLASGKSSVLKILSNYNEIVINADDLARDIYDIIDIKQKTINLFGEDIINLNGKINRDKLRNLLIENPNKVNGLNDITHPVILNKLKDEIAKYEAERIFVEIPLYFESKELVQKYIRVDYVIYIYTEYQSRLERLIKRSGFDTDTAIKFMDLQLPDMYKKSMSDYVIDNNGSIDELELNIKDILKKI